MGVSLLFFAGELLCYFLRQKGLRYSILGHWIRWWAVSLALACSLKLSTAPAAPLGLLFATGATSWFLWESMLLWLHVHRIGSRLSPIFPSYVALDGKICWPGATGMQAMRDLLRQNGFSLECVARTDPASPQQFFCLIFRSDDGLSRLLLRFSGQTLPFFFPTSLIYSLTADGRTVLTENSSGVFAGYYPPSWSVARRPLRQRLTALLDLHGRRQRRHRPIPLDGDPLEQINAMQRALREENWARSFLVRSGEGQRDCLSAEAGFRIWLEFLLLRYLGRPLT
ncbi:MAG: hypothetical protein LBT98_03560 [Puniceicoccales bacterium]|nr:hypothetical protein [Puniceicoccales bacterium]